MLNNLIAHWKMNDNAANTTVLDATGNHNGTFKSAGGEANTADHDVTGKIGNALDFVGDDDYIEVADAAIFSPVLTPFSISAWVYMHEATNFAIASKGISGTDGEWRFHTDSNDRPAMYLWDESIDKYIERVDQTAVAENQWVHLVGTYDGGILVTGLKIYLDGVRVDDKSYYSGSFDGTENLTHAVWIGRYNLDYSNGLIDNVMLFSKALNLKEVRRLYRVGMGTEKIPSLQNRCLRGRYSNWSRSRYR